MPTRHSVRRPVGVLAGLLFAAGVALTGCAGADSGDSGAAKGAARDEAAQPAVGGEAAGPAAGAAGEDTAAGAGSSGNGADAKAGSPAALPVNRIIRTATLTVQVEDVPKALDQARSTTEDAGGYVGEESTTREEDGSEHTRVVLRVPVEKYQAVLTGLQGTGKLVERTAKAQDVTDQVVDVDSRVRSQRASVARVRELMDRATELSDVLSLEAELSKRQADLESLLARQASLKDRTSLATITLTLDTPPAPDEDEDGGKDDDPGLLDALAGGWDAFVSVLRWVAVVVAAVLPFAVAALVLVLVWLRVVRPRRRRAAAPAPAYPPVPAPAVAPVGSGAPAAAHPDEERGEEDRED
ncbi:MULTISPECIES: DUF4349 domain-containing protein [unclassified Streptomyces]|uniref:DUF4349 domain-containing protein n=1 Tax=unclassified Streptomyces TaxID=2593676 RepID=UPI003D72D5AA